MLFRLKQTPRRARAQAIECLSKWLDSVSVDPKSPCRGSSAVQTLFGRLYLEHGNTAVAATLGGDLVVGADGRIHPDGVREYLWGVTEKIVEVEDDVDEAAVSVEEEEDDSEAEQQDAE